MVSKKPAFRYVYSCLEELNVRLQLTLFMLSPAIPDYSQLFLIIP